MKNRLIPCVLTCLMIFLVGCNGNTAKEAAQEITKTETSFPAGNTETNSQEDTAEEPESTAVRFRQRGRGGALGNSREKFSNSFDSGGAWLSVVPPQARITSCAVIAVGSSSRAMRLAEVV